MLLDGLGLLMYLACFGFVFVDFVVRFRFVWFGLLL